MPRPKRNATTKITEEPAATRPKRAKKSEEKVEPETEDSSPATTKTTEEPAATRPKRAKKSEEKVEPETEDSSPATTRTTEEPAATRPKRAKKSEEKVEPETEDSSPATTKTTEEPAATRPKRGKKSEEKVEPETEDSSPDWKNATSIYDFTVKDIDGNDVEFSKYKGNVLLIVNVASRCGHTKKNYTELVQLHEKYADSKGLRILAFPCNQFGKQEPGDSEKIKCFAKARNATFDFFDKVNVNGKDAIPLYNWLKYKLDGEVTGKNVVKWNFTKFIVDKNGQPVERHASAKSPLSLEENLTKYF